MDSLLSKLQAASAPPTPQNFRPGVIYEGGAPSLITTPPLPLLEGAGEYEKAVRDMGYPIPEGCRLVLVEMQLVEHQAAWHRDPVPAGDGRQQGEGEAYTAPTKSWRYRFKVVPGNVLRDDVDLAAMAEEARKAAPKAPDVARGAGTSTRVIALADFQIGKVDELGGTADTLARSEAALATALGSLRAEPASEVIIVDVGDSTEGFESAPNADRTNDLQQTEQIRVWRRILWRWVSAIAEVVDKVVVVSVPSNHCRVRRGKSTLGPASDDWGIEVLAQVEDIAAANPEAYGHVSFHAPRKHDEHVLLTMCGGLVLGVAHGHQKNQPHQLADWVKSTGRRGLAQADIVLTGHFHHLRVQAFGDSQWLFMCPTNDNGSSWFTPSSGERSDAGILTFAVDERGWYDLDPVWLS